MRIKGITVTNDKHFKRIHFAHRAALVFQEQVPKVHRQLIGNVLYALQWQNF